MKLLELFAGSRSVGRVAERMGIQVCSVDIKPFKGIDLARDVEFLQAHELPFVPDIIWASPPCTSYSIAGIGHHRKPDGSPKSDFAAKTDRLIIHTLQLISHYPDAVWYIENPRGMLRKMSFMRGLDRATVWYCKYGASNAKPTDIWSNNIHGVMSSGMWHPRPECHNGNLKCAHDKQPRGYAAKVATGAIGKGTQGMANDYERSKIPEALCAECIGAALNKLATVHASKAVAA